MIGHRLKVFGKGGPYGSGPKRRVMPQSARIERRAVPLARAREHGYNPMSDCIEEKGNSSLGIRP